MLRPLITIGCLTVAGAVCAEPVPLTSETIKETLSGSLLEMDTPLGTKVPVRFSKDGLVSGEAGILAGMLGAEKDRGRWWTKDDQLCVKWFRWFEAKPKCASLSQDGSRIYWRERSGESGTATLAERPQPVAPTTIAKAAVAPEPQTQPEAQAQLETRVLPEPQAQPEQQVAAADTSPLIKQRSVTTTPLDEDRPALMFAGMTGLQDVASLVAPKAKPEVEPAPQQPAEVAALAEPQFETQTVSAPEPPPAAPRQESAAAAAAPSDNANIVDIDAMAGDAPPAGPSIREVSFRVSGVRADDVLNVRSGPSEYHQQVGRIPPAARGVKIIGQCRGEWCPIKRGRVKGWVNSYYLAEETAAAPSQR